MCPYRYFWSAGPGVGLWWMSAPSTFGPYRLVGESSMTSQQPVGQGQGSQQQQKKLRGDRFGLASEWGEEVIIVLEVVADSDGAEPSGDGASADGEEDARQQHGQPPAVACVQPGRQPLAPLRPFARTLPVCFRHPWLSHHLRRGKRSCDGRAFFIARSILRPMRPTAACFQKVQILLVSAFYSFCQGLFPCRKDWIVTDYHHKTYDLLNSID